MLQWSVFLITERSFKVRSNPHLQTWFLAIWSHMRSPIWLEETAVRAERADLFSVQSLYFPRDSLPNWRPIPMSIDIIKTLITPWISIRMTTCSQVLEDQGHSDYFLLKLECYLQSGLESSGPFVLGIFILLTLKFFFFVVPTSLSYRR